MNYTKIKEYYQKGMWNKLQVQKAYELGKITLAERNEILGSKE